MTRIQLLKPIGVLLWATILLLALGGSGQSADSQPAPAFTDLAIGHDLSVVHRLGVNLTLAQLAQLDNAANPGLTLGAGAALRLLGGQLQLGVLAQPPQPLGPGALYFNSKDKQVYFWDGSNWRAAQAEPQTVAAALKSDPAFSKLIQTALLGDAAFRNAIELELATRSDFRAALAQDIGNSDGFRQAVSAALAGNSALLTAIAAELLADPRLISELSDPLATNKALQSAVVEAIRQNDLDQVAALLAKLPDFAAATALELANQADFGERLARLLAADDQTFLPVLSMLLAQDSQLQQALGGELAADSDLQAALGSYLAGSSAAAVAFQVSLAQQLLQSVQFREGISKALLADTAFRQEIIGAIASGLGEQLDQRYVLKAGDKLNGTLQLPQLQVDQQALLQGRLKVQGPTTLQDLTVVGILAGSDGQPLQLSGDLQISGDLTVKGRKFFLQDDPSHPGHEIRFISLEGPEAGVYVRGQAKLHEGQAVITLPEAFRLVAAGQGLTAQLTPRGDCLGLYVVSLTPGRLVVRELGGGKSDISFDYLVQGVRRGYENFQPLSQSDQERPR